FTIGEGELMAHDVPLGCAPDEYDDLISGTCSHLPEQTSMEDLFPKDVLDIELDGKKFNKNNDGDSKTEYGKHVFSVKIVRDKKRKIDFKAFGYIFDVIKDIIEHYNVVLKS
ncbi:hypothetical protein ACSLNF_16280, partial [Citrobacter youngae]